MTDKINPYHEEQIKDTYNAEQYGKGWGGRPMSEGDKDTFFPNRKKEESKSEGNPSDAVSISEQNPR